MVRAKTKAKLALVGASILAFFLMIIHFFQRGKSAGRMQEKREQAREKIRVIKHKQAVLEYTERQIEEQRKEVEREIEKVSKKRDPIRARIAMADVAFQLERTIAKSRAGKLSDPGVLTEDLASTRPGNGNPGGGNPSPSGEGGRGRPADVGAVGRDPKSNERRSRRDSAPKHRNRKR